jgi:uncharacterized protein
LGLFDVQAAVDRGFVVVRQDTRGRFASAGEWMPWKYEREDGYDTIEWAAQLPWSNGKVGMLGGSYLGSTQWSSAMMRPPHLKAIAPSITWADRENGLMFRGGATEHGLNVWGLLTSLAQVPKSGLPATDTMQMFDSIVSDIDRSASRTYWELPLGPALATARSGQPDVGVTRALADPLSMDECRVSNRYDDVEVPSLNIAGWYDVFQQGSVDNYIAMKARGIVSRLIVGPWDHITSAGQSAGITGVMNFGLMFLMPQSMSLAQLQLDWFEHWLRILT